MSQKFVIHLIGHSCVGKSSVQKVLHEKIQGMYVISFDKQKWLLSGYSRDKDVQTIKKICSELFKGVCQMGIPVFLVVPLSTEVEYSSFKTVAQEHGYEFLSFQLSAPEEVLLNRFRERLESYNKVGGNMSVTSEELYKQNLQKSFFVPDDIISFDTSSNSPDDIAQEILKKIYK